MVPLYPQEFLKNNDPPPDEVLQRVKAHLHIARPAKDEALKRAYLDLETLEERMEDMELKLQEHETSLFLYKSILSPARRIPIDILHHIFYRCLPAQRNPLMSSYEAPMVLTQVCRTWRAIALSSPRLWSKIHITYAYSSKLKANSDSMSEPDQDLPTVDGDTILRMRCDAVKQWLHRSGSCPISISIMHTGNNPQRPSRDNDESSKANTLELFKTIVLFCDRWEKIELIMPADLCSLLGSLIPVDNLSLLKNVRILIAEHYPMQEHQWDGSGSALLRAPNLREVSLVGWYAKSWRPTMAQWKHLTHFSCYSPLHVDDCFYLLCHAGKLVRCTLRLLTLKPPNQTIQLHGLAFLPCLHTLSIIGNPAQRRVTAELVGKINAPRLLSIAYEVPETHHNNFTLENAQFPFLHLLEVTTIQSLTIDPRHLSDSLEEWITILRLSKNVVDLFIGSRTTTQGEADEHPYIPFNYLALFQLLTIDSDAVSTRNSEVILPNLQVFSASVNYSITKDILANFIKSRMDPTSPHGVAVLKTVTIAFPQKPEDYDYFSDDPFIPPNAHGVEVQTFFQFINNSYNNKETSFYSLRYGLKRSNDRSWPHEDVDESVSQ
ncbi:hypothetical protein JR316_0012272 [Psilocybe cubensis]|uniref:F-box domain-containing protein n=2 Tax=Psilocybe cubensis TaxID=181762 RepID=A0A8H7XMJ1_PSICU|nr:hypothetical protein JR316_0012272 [Psilocybe cubensis]KAH9475161.1 hypothetical protein JR316_0012272 [Psilocybe cubensis]